MKIVLDNICLRIELAKYKKRKNGDQMWEIKQVPNFAWYLYKDDRGDLLVNLLFLASIPIYSPKVVN